MQGSAPVKYFVGILTADVSLREHIVHVLSDHLGAADYTSAWYPFSHTNYYMAEMGENLERSFVSFETLYPPEDLPRIKALTIKTEDKFRQNKNRRINIDPGYVDFTKVVMASGKFGAYRIAITKGCYADMVLYYSKGVFQAPPWGFKDFEDKTYQEALLKIRNLFKEGRNLS